MAKIIKSAHSVYWLSAMVLAGLVLFVLSLSLLMIPYSNIIDENKGSDLTCLQIPFTQARAAQIINSYNDESRSAARSLHLPGDLLFPIGYALLYAGLIGLIIRGQEGWWFRLGLVVMLFPFAAMVLDWIENLFILSMLAIATEESVAAIPSWMPAVGGSVGALKYLFLSLLTPLFGISLVIWSLVKRQPELTAGLTLTYLITLAMLGFSLYQLFTEVLPCLGPL